MTVDTDRLRSEVSVLKRELASRDEELSSYNRIVALNGNEKFNSSYSPERQATVFSDTSFESEARAATILYLETRDGKPHQLLMTPTSGDTHWSDLMSCEGSEMDFHMTERGFSKTNSSGAYLYGLRPIPYDAAHRGQSFEAYPVFPDAVKANRPHLLTQLDTLIVAMEFVLK